MTEDNEIYRAEDLMSSYDGSTMAGIYRKTTPPIPHVIIYDSGTMVFQLVNSLHEVAKVLEFQL